uniref:Uncharacterized protein n=1 Tax=Arion vulgaris TaxID=1028688 RepID=A0A0B7ARX7_9EUPU
MVPVARCLNTLLTLPLRHPVLFVPHTCSSKLLKSLNQHQYSVLIQQLVTRKPKKSLLYIRNSPTINEVD